MTCQACQTWNSDEEHRCRRCGRRFRTTPTRRVRDAYPIAATALAYQHDVVEESEPVVEAPAPVSDGGQPSLFVAPPQPRVIPFDQLTSPAERESIRARAAELSRANVVPSAKVEVSARRNRRNNPKGDDQQQFDFFGKPEVAPQPQSTIQCGAPVAPPLVRLNAALVDGFMILAGTFLCLVVFRLMTGSVPTSKLALAGYGAVYLTIALAYKLMWCFANRESFGMSATRLRLVDLDGNKPSQKSRFWRVSASFLSLGAVGLGLIWTFADADGLAWHDQISDTFPTFNED